MAYCLCAFLCVALMHLYLTSYVCLHLPRFLTKLLTEDLPRLFVRPNKIVLDFQKGKAVGPVSNDFKTGEIQEGNKDFVGELSVTLVDARKLAYVFFGITLLPDIVTFRGCSCLLCVCSIS